MKRASFWYCFETGTEDYLGFVSDRAGKYCCFATSVIFT